MPPPFLELKCEPSKSACCLLPDGFCLDYPLTHKTGGDMFLQNIGLISTQITQRYISEDRTHQGMFSICIPLSSILIGVFQLYALYLREYLDSAFK
jgi:hypothetical protein